VIGGTQSLHCNGRDEALGLPTEESARIALRTQQIIAHESGVPNTVDPFGGSYAVEHLTNEIESGARAILERIQSLGGTLAAIEAGVIQREIQESAYTAQLRVDAAEAVVVGVNRHATSNATGIEVLEIDPAIEHRQVERVRHVRATRDAVAWQAAIEAVRQAAAGTDNLVPPIVAAVEARATVGEISDAMRAVFGEHEEIDV
jgi:methylmalonyl-CoA mutase N-terminal domain/subunit